MMQTAKRSQSRALECMVLLGVAITVSGCTVQQNGTKGNEDVKIATPMGAMQVKTNAAVVLADIGLPLYPGAVPLTKKEGHDDGAADVNMSFGNFRLRVKAASFHTNDPSDKVLAYYQKELGRYGDVIQCKDNHAVGKPLMTSEGLTCDNDKHSHIQVDEGMAGSKLELKAGSKQHQHIVAIDPQSDGTKFGLVMLDLPGGNMMGGKETN